MDNVPIVSNGVPEEGMQIWKLFSCVFGYNLLVLGRVILTLNLFASGGNIEYIFIIIF